MANSFNCLNQQPPSYSGVTINIGSPSMNIPPQYPCLPCTNSTSYQNEIMQNQGYQGQMLNPVMQQSTNGMPDGVNSPYMSNPSQPYINRGSYLEPVNSSYSPTFNISNDSNTYQTIPAPMQNMQQTYPSQTNFPIYPQQYYLNNFEYQQGQQNYPNSLSGNNNGTQNDGNQQENVKDTPATAENVNTNQSDDLASKNNSAIIPSTQDMDQSDSSNGQSLSEEDVNTEISQEIIENLNARAAEEKELEKNGKKTRIIALTNEYIMSLENYLNNPNTDIRLMAAKEVLTRLDEDKDRYDDAALNALLNKMLQDPNKLIRIAALSALSSELASGNDYTVQLLNQIQQNPEADPEDVLEASQILLKRSATTEIRYVPVQPKQESVEEPQ